MRIMQRFVPALLFLIWAQAASGQTVDEIIERSLAAVGGRPALATLKSRSMTGTIVLATPAGDIKGSVEMLNAAPNKSRMLMKADLTALGAGEIVVDQRFDGHTGYVLDSLQGNRDITGNQLDNLRNGSFPHPFLNYKELGTTAKLSGKEKVGDRDMFVIVFDPTSGSAVRQYIDAQTYLPARLVTTVDVPQLGQEVEQTMEFLDYRDVDGVKLPFRMRATSVVQNFTITIDKMQHNVAVDESLFSKPKD